MGIMLIATAFTETKAQAYSNKLQYTTLTGSGDSIVGATTKYLTFSLPGVVLGGSVEAILTKSSGNARATLTMEVSNDGINWYAVTTGVSHTLLDKTIVDTITNTSGAQRKVFLLEEKLCKGFIYGRIKCAGAGTTGHTIVTGSIYRRFNQ